MSRVMIEERKGKLRHLKALVSIDDNDPKMYIHTKRDPCTKFPVKVTFTNKRTILEIREEL